MILIVRSVLTRYGVRCSAAGGQVAGVGQEEMLLLAQDYETTAKSAEDARRVQEQQKMQAVRRWDGWRTLDYGTAVP